MFIWGSKFQNNVGVLELFLFRLTKFRNLIGRSIQNFFLDGRECFIWASLCYQYNFLFEVVVKFIEVRFIKLIKLIQFIIIIIKEFILGITFIFKQVDTFIMLLDWKFILDYIQLIISMIIGLNELILFIAFIVFIGFKLAFFKFLFILVFTVEQNDIFKSFIVVNIIKPFILEHTFI